MIKARVGACLKGKRSFESWLLYPPFWVAIWLLFAVELHVRTMIGSMLRPLDWTLLQHGKVYGAVSSMHLWSATLILCAIYLAVSGVGALLALRTRRGTRWRVLPLARGIVCLLFAGLCGLVLPSFPSTMPVHDAIESAETDFHEHGQIGWLAEAHGMGVPGVEESLERLLDHPDPTCRFAAAAVLVRAGETGPATRRVLTDSMDAYFRLAGDPDATLEGPQARRIRSSLRILDGESTWNVLWFLPLDHRGWIETRVRPWWEANRARFDG